MPFKHMSTDPYLPDITDVKAQVEINELPLTHTTSIEDLDHHRHPDKHVTNYVLARRSARAFHPDRPIPQAVLEECLSLAQRAPSNSNIQPWRVTICTGAALQRVGEALCEAVKANVPSTIEPIPSHFIHYRSAMGHKLYGPEGYDIPRHQIEELATARLRNYRFFHAPCAAIISMDKSLAAVDILSVGLYMQTLMYLLQERGIATCPSVSVTGYPDILRRELGIAENMQILSGLAIGYEDEEHKVSRLRMDRDEFWKESVRFVNE